MKKLFLFFLLSSQSILFSQTVLNSFPLNLNLSEAQLLNIEDVKTHDVYVFASDNRNINILKYNQSLFLTSQFTDSIRYAADRVLLGYSIGADKAPLLYWSSSNLRNIRIIKYFTETKTTRSLNFDFPEAHDYILASFQKNNIFYILAKEKAQQHLLLYKFENGNCEIKMFDFSPFTFQNGRGQSFSFTTLIRYYPIQMMESDDFNSIDKTSNINKLYVLDDRLILTLDYNSKKTQVFDLNMETAEITEKAFDLPVSVKPSRTANSFYSDKKLFQMTANKDQFLFTIKDYDTGKTIKSSSISKNDTIQFKNSPLFIQNNNNRPQELKTTAKFLRNLADLSAGISVIKNNKNNFITFGGFVEYVDSDYMYNTDEIFNFSGMRSLSRMVYFDAMLNENYDFVKDVKSEPLAVDNLFYYLSVNKGMMLQNSLKLKDYYILSYYDIASKQFIMRKFTNGFVSEDNGNPIMNKSIFSRPASFEDIKQP